MHKSTLVATALLLVATVRATTYPNATRLGRRAEPGPALVGPCTDDQAYCAGPEDYCCPLDLACEVDEDAGTYNCVLGDTEPDPEPEPEPGCTEPQTDCGGTCCPANSVCLDSSCLVCLNGETPCGNICCGAGSTCDAEASECSRDGDMTGGGGGSTTTKAPGSSTSRGGTNPTPTGPGGSSISVGGGTSTPGPNSATSAKSGAWVIVGALLAFIGA